MKSSRGQLKFRPALTQDQAEPLQQLTESEASMQKHIAQSYPQLSQIGSAYGLLIERRVKSRMAPTNLVGHLAGLLIRMLVPVLPRARKLAKKLEANRAFSKTYLTIKYSGLFDSDYYLQTYPDLRGKVRDPAKHYVRHGAKEGRNPSPYFSTLQYLEANPDVSKANINPFAHYIRHGIAEGRLAKITNSQACGASVDLPCSRDLKQTAVERLLPRSLSGGALSHWFVDPSTATNSARASVYAETRNKCGEDFRICCLAHVYYADLWPELARYIFNMQEVRFELYVNLVDTTWTEELHSAVRQDFPKAHIYVSPNRGRDIGGFFALLRNIEIDKYDVFCLVHTKKSPHMDKFAVQKWRDDLLGAILGSRQIVRENVNLLSQNEVIGLIGTARWRNTSLYSNADRYYRLLDELGIEGEHRRCEYLSGTMMFLRASVLKEIYMALCEIEFEDGDNRSLEFHMDGQIAHVIERLIGNIVRKQGYVFAWR